MRLKKAGTGLSKPECSTYLPGVPQPAVRNSQFLYLFFYLFYRTDSNSQFKAVNSSSSLIASSFYKAFRTFTGRLQTVVSGISVFLAGFFSGVEFWVFEKLRAFRGKTSFWRFFSSKLAVKLSNIGHKLLKKRGVEGTEATWNGPKLALYEAIS